MSARFSARLFGFLLLLLAAGCSTASAADPADTGAPANSGTDLWYTLITAVIGFVVGFLVAGAMSRMGNFRRSAHRHHHRRRTDAGWDRISERIQAGTSQGLAEWRSAEHAGNTDWDDLSRRVKQRILEEMRKHQD